MKIYDNTPRFQDFLCALSEALGVLCSPAFLVTAEFAERSR